MPRLIVHGIRWSSLNERHLHSSAQTCGHRAVRILIRWTTRSGLQWSSGSTRERSMILMNWENSSQPLGITWNSRLLTRQSISGTSGLPLVLRPKADTLNISYNLLRVNITFVCDSKRIFTKRNQSLFAEVTVFLGDYNVCMPWFLR